MTQAAGYNVGKIPVGDQGARDSIWKVAKAATAGRMSPKVRAWALRELKNAGSPKTVRDRAAAILAGVRRDVPYVPDPVHGEFIASAEELLSGVMPGGDCDDCSVATLAAMLAALESVGITAVAVGHSYRSDRILEHVLVAIWDPTEERWWYADPSTMTPFGEWPMRPSWEYVVTAPGLTLLCDAEVCLSGQYAARPEVLTMDGDYVGVAGLPHLDELSAGVGAANTPDLAPYFQRLRDDLEWAWSAFLATYETMVRVHGILGIPLLDPAAPAVTADLSTVTAWGPDVAQRVLDLQSMKDLALAILDDAIEGRRKVSIVGSEYGIEQLSTDEIRFVWTAAGPAMERIADGAIVHATGTVGVGGAAAAIVPVLQAAWPIVLVAGIVIGLIYAADAAKSIAEKVTETKVVGAYADCLAKNDPAVCDGIRKIDEDIRKTPRPKGPGEDVAEAIRAVSWLLGISAVVYGASKVLPVLLAKRQPAAA